MDLETVKEVDKEIYTRTREFYIESADGGKVLLKRQRYFAHNSTATDEKPLRNADNRIPSNFHGLLVDQKVCIYVYVTAVIRCRK